MKRPGYVMKKTGKQYQTQIIYKRQRKKTGKDTTIKLVEKDTNKSQESPNL